MANFKLSNAFAALILISYLSTVFSFKTYDYYVIEAKSKCDTDQSYFACLKYRLGRYLWSFDLNYLNSVGRSISKNNDNETDLDYEFVTLNSTAMAGEELFPEARFSAGDSELTKGLNFVKRAISHFAANNGIRLPIDDEGGVFLEDLEEYEDSDNVESGRKHRRKRGNRIQLKKKKKKLKILFTFLALMKLFGIKILLKLVLLSIGLVQLMVIGAGAGLFLYLRRNTLCKVQPYLVHTSTHTQSESEAPFSSEKWPVSVSAYNKDWASARAYQGQLPAPYQS